MLTNARFLSLLTGTSGKARSMVVDAVDAKTIVPILEENIAQRGSCFD